MTSISKNVLEAIQSAQLSELEEIHSQMLATASDLGYEPPAETLVEITSEEQGREICARLHDALDEHRERMAREAKSSGKRSSKKDLADDDQREDTDGAGKPAKRRRAKTETTDAAEEPQEQKETDVAQAKKVTKKVAKAPAKKTAAPKKGATKKAAPAKKGAAKAPAKRASGGRLGSYRPDQRITWRGDKDGGLGAREGSGRAERRALVKRHSGKTVQAFVDAGGKAATLANCVAAKLASVA